jgi:formylglycine-generating enzyme required for sulfatase activity
MPPRPQTTSRAVFAALGVIALAATACGVLPAFQPCDDAHPCAVDRMCVDGLCVARPVGPGAEAGLLDAEPPEADAEECVPRGEEVCGNGIDDDCDGEFDDGFTYGADGLHVGEACDGVGECGAGMVICSPDGTGTLCSTDPGGPAHVAGVERCDGLDNNCDGVVDDGLDWKGLAVGAPCLEGTGCGVGTVVCGAGAMPTCDTLANAVDELCNGVDDDCDGETDEGLAWNGRPVGSDCAGEGACGVGVVECFNGTPVCSVNPDGSGFAGTDELCDGIDNDCDGRIDEGFFPDDAEVGSACAAPGACGAGRFRCIDETTGVCDSAPGQPGSPATDEICNGLDDDCDGLIDDGLFAEDGTPVGEVCAGRGRCPEGVYQCGEGGVILCSTLPPSPLAPVEIETCNGIDDDCDGFTDDGLEWQGLPVGQPCDPPGECGAGTVVCGADGRAICDTAPGGPGQGASPEICDAADNDCDGEVDEDFRDGAEALGAACIAPGACGAGIYECSADGAGVRCDTAPGGSRDASVPEQCNGLDDDCDGEVDEDFRASDGSAVGAACDGVGACGAGVVECSPDGAAARCSTEPGGSAFVAVDETCNGLDDDCDGETDEADPRECVACAVDGATGQCGFGAFLCEGGRLTCVPHLPPAGEAPACDGLDNDCNGRTDEAGESVPAPFGAEARVVERCGPAPLANGPADPAACALDPDPARGVCAAWHGCLEPACAIRCQTGRLTAFDACEDTCADPEPGVRSACLSACRAAAERADVACRTACPPADPVAFGFTCGGGAAGPACAPVCPAAYRAEGNRCVPAGEICNNGLDDEGDGLIDGVLSGPDPCAASATVAAPPWPEAGRYAYAVDREEVSHRAWLQCVQTGCCLPASGRAARLAEQAANALPNGQRPPDERIDRCDAPVDLDTLGAGAPPEALAAVLDLPVTGVSWCQARDFCHWAGKRLATELELAYAAAGEAPLRSAPWGESDVPVCAGDQRCRNDNCPPDDATCAPFPRCPAALPDAPATGRAACYAQYGEADACGGETGPAPVWGNQDGATPSGVRNLVGNVAEWAFDWAAPVGAGPLATDTAVGPACGFDAGGPAPRRVLRGGHSATPADGLLDGPRGQAHPALRSTLVGFRCARTLDPDGDRCLDTIPHVRAVDGACRPPALPPGRAEDDCGPDFTAVALAGDDQTVCGGQRATTDTCEVAAGRFCPLAEGPDCRDLSVDRMHVDVAAAPGVDAEVAREFGGLLDLALAGRGGQSFFVLDGLLDFDLFGGLPVRIGSALALGDALRWLGLSEGLSCDAAPLTPYFALDKDAQSRVGGCGAAHVGELWTLDVPVRLRFGAVGFEGRWAAETASLLGTLTLFVSAPDAAVSVLGGEPLAAWFARLGLPRVSLCDGAASGVPACADRDIEVPGCAFGFCQDPALCEGWRLPLQISARRVREATLAGEIDAPRCP